MASVWRALSAFCWMLELISSMEAETLLHAGGLFRGPLGHGLGRGRKLLAARRTLLGAVLGPR